MDLKETYILADEISQHWYYRSKAEAMNRLLGETKSTTIVDVGAGSGFFSRYLLENSKAQQAWCVDISYDKESDAVQNNKPIHFRRTLEKIDADLVLLMDVLEHVDDDLGFLSTYVNNMPRGARFLISVPAFQFLWSNHDVFLEHKRRYQLNHVEKLVQNAGLVVTRSFYYFGAVFPIAFTIRVFSQITKSTMSARSQLTKHHPLVNSALATLCRAELHLMRFNRVAGLSVFCLAEKF